MPYNYAVLGTVQGITNICISTCQYPEEVTQENLVEITENPAQYINKQWDANTQTWSTEKMIDNSPPTREEYQSMLDDFDIMYAQFLKSQGVNVNV